MRSKVTWMGVSLVAVVSLGCAGDRNGRLASVADSAGVEIVTNERSFAQMPVRVIPDEFVHEIADEALYQVTGIQPLSGDRIAVGVNGAGSILVYSATGERVATFGQMGDGPGEFRSVGSLVSLPGDSLGGYDPRHRRLTVFPPDDGTPRVVSLADVAPERGWSRVLPLRTGLACVGEAGLGGRTEQGVYRNTEKSYRIDVDGQVLATYGEFPGLQAFVGSGLMGRAPFGALLASATWGDQLIIGTGEAAELRVFGPSGALSRIIRWVDVDRTVTQQRMNEHVGFLLSQVPQEQAGAMRDRLAEMPFAPEMPTHAEVLASPSGVIWVGEYPGPEAELPTGRHSITRQWVIFAPDGVIQERIQTPQGFMPTSLGDDLVWGVYHDALDVESLRAYRVAS